MPNMLFSPLQGAVLSLLRQKISTQRKGATLCRRRRLRGFLRYFGLRGRLETSADGPPYDPRLLPLKQPPLEQRDAGRSRTPGPLATLDATQAGHDAQATSLYLAYSAMRRTAPSDDTMQDLPGSPAYTPFRRSCNPAAV